MKAKLSMFRHVVRGCGTLPRCGEHPGTPFLIFIVALGAVAGVRKGWIGCLIGALMMLLVFGSMYCIGAYERSKLDDGN